MPNMDPWINQNEPTNKFENDLLSIRDERQKMIRPNCHPNYNERHQKIIELIDWTLEKYKANMEKTQQQNDEQEVTIDNIIDELDKKREIAINKKRQALLKDEVWKYGEEEDTIDYVLFRIRELTGRLNQNKSNIIFPSFTLYYLYPYREFFLWYYLI
jgi:hypothetical protein